MSATNSTGWRRDETGAALYIVAGSMVVLLAMSALAIDLVSFYLARTQAQRAADAGALAGASIFVSEGCTNTGGCVSGGPQEAPATTQAIAVAGQNEVAGQAPSASTVTVAFNYPDPAEPQINVTVHRDSASGNPLNTFFGRILGINTVDVSATAWAEAYAGTGSPLGTTCLRPFFVPNCDVDHPVQPGNAAANTQCGGTQGGTDGIKIPCFPGDGNNCYPSYFVYPSGSNQGSLVNPGVYSTLAPYGGVVGEPWQLHDNAAPSEWYEIQFGNEAGSTLRDSIMLCNPAYQACNRPLNGLNGLKVGPTDQGIDALIQYCSQNSPPSCGSDGPGQGQDSICSPVSLVPCTLPFPITGGSKNPISPGQVFYGGPSNALMTVAVYDGFAPPSGNTFSADVRGFIQLFVVDAQGPNGDRTNTPPGFVSAPDTVDTIVMGVSGCGTGTQGPPVVGPGPVPIRLIHQ